MFLLTGPLIRQYVIVITVNLSVLCLGFGLVWPSPVLVKLRDASETPLKQPMTEEEGSWIVSMGFLSAAFANFIPAFLVDRIGRKYTVLLACLPKLIICLLFLFAKDVWMILLGRGIGGVTDAMLFTVVPMYASEIASKEVRGSLGTILQIFSSLGIVFMLSVGPFISYIHLNVIFMCLFIVTTIPILFLPDSPYYLYTKGRTDESLKILTFLRGSEAIANEEIKEYALANTDSKTDTTIDKRAFFKNKIFLKSLGIVIFLGAGLQLVGFNAVSFYLQTILESTQTTIKPEIASVIIGFIQLVASFCTAFVTDKFGRKPILTTMSIGMAVGMIGLGTFFKLRETREVAGFMNFLPLISLILVVYCYSAGTGSIYWMLITELFEGPARAIGVSSSLFVSTIFGFLTTKYFYVFTNSLGPPATYWTFAVMCVIFCLFVMFCVPETKGKTFGEIQVALGAKSFDDSIESVVEKRNNR